MAQQLPSGSSRKTSRPREDNGVSCSPDIDNTGRGVLKIRNVAWEINDKYTSSGDLNCQRAENGGYTNAEKQKLEFLAIQNIYHPSISANQPVYNSPTDFVRPASWSSTTKLGVPDAYTASTTITGNDGRQYVELRDKASGDVLSFIGEHSCLKSDISAFNPVQQTIQSLRSDEQHFEIQYKINPDGTIFKRSETEKQFRANLIDLENKTTELPYQLNMMDIVTNDLHKESANDPVFNSAAPVGIKTSVTPNDSFVTGGAAPDPSKSIMFQKTVPHPTAPLNGALNDPAYELKA